MASTTYEQGHSHSPFTGKETGWLGFILHYAEGHAPLWKAFWIWGVLLSWILFGILAGLAGLMGGINWGLFILATIIMMPYTAWILVAVWQCAFNVEDDLWGYLARFLTVVWAVNIGMAGGLLMAELILA